MTFQLSETLLKAAEQLHIRAKRNVSALLTGNYSSKFRGSGMQFKEFRHYQAGDDIRHMSWLVTARTGKPTIKVYEEERELDIVCLVDSSGSSLFGYQNKRRIEMIGELVALVGLAAIRSGDNFGMLLFANEPGQYLPPNRNRNQIQLATTLVLQSPSTGKTSQLGMAIERILTTLKRRSIVMIFSDFFVPPFETQFHMLTAKHETILVHCYDDAERGQDLSAVHAVCDPETLTFSVLDGRSKVLQRALAQQHTAMTSYLEQLCRNRAADYLCLSSQDDYFQRLVHFFRSRGPAHL
ncbi:MAG: DUF58 domain-containing protein [Deltaproteobacteria bacterium]|nr:DUF58 domain-containing protein [Deltaproteobacteria bacterium]